MKKHILITCFDISGDHNTFDLLTYYLKHLKPKYKFSLVCGEKVKKLAGPDFEIIADHITESAIGIFESIQYIYSTLKFFKWFKKYITTKNFDLLLCVDGQGRNITLGNIAKKQNIKTAYFFPPPVSHFGKWNVRKMKIFDLILCPFEAEHEIYAKKNLNSVFTGHPFMNYFTQKKPTLPHQFPHPLISIFPGSRSEEIDNLTPIFFQTVSELQKKFPNYSWVVSLSHKMFDSKIKENLKKYNLNIEIIHNCSDEVIANSYYILCCSGTATLKASFWGIPHLIAYHLSWINYWSIQLLMHYKVGIYVEYIGIINVLSKREVIKEFFHCRLDVKKLVKEASIYLESPQKRKEKSSELLTECKKSLASRKEKSFKNPLAIIWEEIDTLLK